VHMDLLILSYNTRVQQHATDINIDRIHHLWNCMQVKTYISKKKRNITSSNKTTQIRDITSAKQNIESQAYSSKTNTRLLKL
jgi:hypothetical protein